MGFFLTGCLNATTKSDARRATQLGGPTLLGDDVARDGKIQIRAPEAWIPPTERTWPNRPYTSLLRGADVQHQCQPYYQAKRICS